MKNMKRACALLLITALLMSVCAVSASAATYVYATGKAYLRKGAGTDYRSITTVQTGSKMEKLGSSRDDRNVLWYKVRVDGYTGWISSIYVTTTKGGSSTKGTVTMTGSENIRYFPNKSSESLGVIPSGMKVSYYDISTDGRGVDWYLIRYNDITGWISSKNTKHGSSTKTTYIIADGGKSNIRKGPGLDYRSIGTLPANATAVFEGTIRYDDRDVAWYKISYDGMTGWVSSRYTSKIKK